MKTFKNLRCFVQSLHRSNLFGKIEVRDGVVFARLCRDYFSTCDILCHKYLDSHRVASLDISRYNEYIVITVNI